MSKRTYTRCDTFAEAAEQRLTFQYTRPREARLDNQLAKFDDQLSNGLAYLAIPVFFKFQ